MYLSPSIKVQRSCNGAAYILRLFQTSFGGNAREQIFDTTFLPSSHHMSCCDNQWPPKSVTHGWMVVGLQHSGTPSIQIPFHHWTQLMVDPTHHFLSTPPLPRGISWMYNGMPDSSPPLHPSHPLLLLPFSSAVLLKRRREDPVTAEAFPSCLWSHLPLMEVSISAINLTICYIFLKIYISFLFYWVLSGPGVRKKVHNQV